MSALPRWKQVLIERGFDPGEFKVGFQEWFSKPCQSYIRVPYYPDRPNYPYAYYICPESKEIVLIDSTD